MVKDMNRLNLAEKIEVENELETKGYKKAVGFVVVESGLLSASLELESKIVDRKKVIDPVFSVMPFARQDQQKKEIPLFWSAVIFNAIHTTSGKTYTNLKVNANSDLLDEVSKPENFSRKCTLLSSISKDARGRDRSIITFVEWN